jgi:hypothetical protein
MDSVKPVWCLLGYWLDDRGIWFRFSVGVTFRPAVESNTVGPGNCYPRVKEQVLKLTTHLHQVLKLKLYGIRSFETFRSSLTLLE